MKNYQLLIIRLIRHLGLLVFMAALIAVQACEKDDICVDGDTPLLLIRFYDIAAPESPKTVNSLRIIGLGQEEVVNTIADRSNLDSISLPLRIGEGETRYVFILNSDGDPGAETGNPDTLTFSYSNREEFISRACGFVATFVDLQVSVQADSENWIQDFNIINGIIRKQDSAHVSIFH
ncbi:DUF6452 family protein [Robiginitalea sp. IMCC44478]|uniref:DUF6452 family protein n=1 Tax=Robiginitalea sp. IMCC44478 TaxID=3459122 RepID=UPI004041C68D